MSILDQKKIIFLDIETVSQFPSYENLDDRGKVLWDKKAKFLKETQEESSADVYNKAGIYAEFGKIICISLGFFHGQEFRLKALYGDNEKKILEDFCKIINSFGLNISFAAHNGKEFDFPYICRRLLINGLLIPDALDARNKKPWETNFIDTMELWKFGDFKSYTSLDLLTYIFDIPTPKDDIDGSKVGEYYWEKKELKTIASYCKKDVIALTRLFLKYYNLQDLTDDNIIEVD